MIWYENCKCFDDAVLRTVFNFNIVQLNRNEFRINNFVVTGVRG